MSTRPSVRRLALALALASAGAAPAPALAAAACPPGMKPVAGGAYRLADGRSARIVPFCLDATGVTVAAWSRCVDARACSAERLECGPAATWNRKGGAALPINCVDWFEADGYCRAHGKRLPSEEEWEWAARGGGRARDFPWGTEPPAGRACWDGDGNAAGKGERRAPCKVASHPRSRSADGVDDLAGNVREWTASAEEDRFRVLRGGSWGDSLPEFLQAAFRGWNAPDERMELIGFRCASARGAVAVVPRAPAVAAVRREDGVVEMPLLVGPSRRGGRGRN